MFHRGTIDLATAHLSLRRFTIEDAEGSFYNWAAEPDTFKYVNFPVSETLEAVEGFMKFLEEEYKKDTTYCWCIELNENEQPIGIISANDIDDDLESARIVTILGSTYWHRGYGVEATTAVVDYFMDQLAAKRVWGAADTHNEFALNVMLRSGMSWEGTLRHAEKNNNGIADISVFAKIAAEVIQEDEDEEAVPSTTKIVNEDGTTSNFISDEVMEYVGILAKLELSPEEAEAAKKDMAEMLDYIDQLDELDTTGIEPMSHVFPVNNVFRADVVTNGDGHEKTLANAPVAKDGGFKVPKTIGE